MRGYVFTMNMEVAAVVVVMSLVWVVIEASSNALWDEEDHDGE